MLLMAMLGILNTNEYIDARSTSGADFPEQINKTQSSLSMTAYTVTACQLSTTQKLSMLIDSNDASI